MGCGGSTTSGSESRHRTGDTNNTGGGYGGYGGHGRDGYDGRDGYGRQHGYGGQGGHGRYDDNYRHDRTPPPRDPTPPPREPTPPPRELTKPPPRELTPPPREPTPPPREPTPPQQGNYKSTDVGTFVYDIDFRSHNEDLDKDYSIYPKKVPFVDKHFPLHVAISGKDNLEWKRPSEFCSNPVLFSDGATRFDIGQGGAGTCWFLSMVAGLADRPELFRRVIDNDAWNQRDGVFTCKFWRYGEWETVHIDDYLPIIYGNQLWGAKSKDDNNEMWPALLEKAFARFHGNYDSAYGGQSGDAFLALTGGVSEYVDFDKDLEADSVGSMQQARVLHNRIKNACNNGSLLATEVPERYDNHCGLVGGHAYSLTGAVTVKDNTGKQIHLVRVRNPWGHTEWQGPWRDGSEEWTTIPSNAIQHANIDDGEFWIELKEFITYFSGVTFCSLTPDFDRDGQLDTLNYTAEILGEWSGPTAAGFQNRIESPKYLFYVSDEGMDVDGCVPLVLQVCQKILHRKKDVVPIRIDLYQVLAENNGSEPMIILELLGDITNVYKTERQMCSRYKVEPGYYVAVPSTMEPCEKQFLVRIFSPIALSDIRVIGEEASVLEMAKSSKADSPSVDSRLKQCQCVFGSWRNGFNAGGQVSNDTFYTNPVVEFSVPDRGDQMVQFCLMQEASEGRVHPIGFRVFSNDDGYRIKDEEDPEFQSQLYSRYESCPRDRDGDQGTFVAGKSAQSTYVLRPGRYFIILHTDQKGEEARFALMMRSNFRIEPIAHRM